MPDGDLLELTDPRAMRALAHPLRLRMLRMLQRDGPATATSLAAAPDVEPAWASAALFANTTAHLTVDEMNELNARLVDMLRAYERPDAARRPADARRVRY